MKHDSPSKLESREEWRAHGRDAEKPSQLPAKGWKDVALRVKSEVAEDDIATVSAALAFYAMLAVFPGLVALISLYGLFADPVDVERQINSVAVLLPGEARTMLEQQLHGLVASSSGGLGLGAVFGILGALWSASSGVASLIAAINKAYDEKETRGFFKLRGLALAFTLGHVLFAIVALGLIALVPVLLGSLATSLQPLIDLGRWPFLAFSVVLGLSLLYRYAPNRDRARWRWVTWGSGVATIVWLLASAAFSLYVSNFGNYDKTYGTLGSVIVLLLWFYVSAFAILLGAEINSELEAQTAKDSTIGPNKPLGHRGASKADELGDIQTA